MAKDYKKMTEDEQSLIDQIQVLTFDYINSKDLDDQERLKCLFNILYYENEAAKMGLYDGIGRVWFGELARYLFPDLAEKWEEEHR